MRSIVKSFFDTREFIQDEEYEIYVFGLKQLLISIVNFLTVLLLGLLLQNVIQTCIYVVAFMIIRSYSGGYHASTPLRCYILTTITNIIILSVIKYVHSEIFILLCVEAVSGCVILALSPVSVVNRPLDNIEYIYYRKKSIMIYVIEIVISVMFLLTGYIEGAECIMCAHAVLAVSLLVESMKKVIVQN